MTLGAFRDLPDDEQSEMVEFERQVCPRCGNLKSVCSDRERTWHAGTAVCWPSATREWAWRQIQKQYEGMEGDSTSLSPLDGLVVYASEFPPPEDEDPFRGEAG